MKVELTEAKLRQMIESVVRESFDDPELSRQIKSHGGTVPTRDTNKFSPIRSLDNSWEGDARTLRTGSNSPDLDAYYPDTNAHFDLKKSKFDRYIEPDDVESLRHRPGSTRDDLERMIATNDGGAVLVKGGENYAEGPDFNSSAYGKRLNRLAGNTGLSPKEKYSGMHLSKDDRNNLFGQDDVEKFRKGQQRDRRKKGINTYSVDPIEKRAKTYNGNNKSGVTKIGSKNEARKTLKRVVSEQVRKALHEAFDDPEMSRQINAHGGLTKNNDMFLKSSLYNNAMRYNKTPYSPSDARYANGSESERYNPDGWDSFDLKRAKFGKYYSPEEANSIGGDLSDLSTTSYGASNDIAKALGKRSLPTNDGGVIMVNADNADNDFKLADKRSQRNERLKGLSGKERYSGMHFKDDDRKKLSTPDDVEKLRKKNGQKSPEAGARQNKNKRSGATKVGQKNESRKSLKRIVAEQTRKALLEYGTDPTDPHSWKSWSTPYDDEDTLRGLNADLDEEEVEIVVFGYDGKYGTEYPDLWNKIVKNYPDLKKYENYIPYLSLSFMFYGDVGVEDGEAIGMDVKSLEIDGTNFEVRSGVEETDELLDIALELNEFLEQNEAEITKIAEEWINNESSALNDDRNWAEQAGEYIDSHYNDGSDIEWWDR